MMAARAATGLRRGRMLGLARSMFERSARIVQKPRRNPAYAFNHHAGVAAVHLLHGDYRSAAESARCARRAFGLLDADAQRARLLRVEAIIASEAERHDEAALAIKELRDARASHDPYPPDPIEVLRDDAAEAQVRIRAGGRTKSATQLELARILEALTGYQGRKGPLCALVSDIRERVNELGDRAPPIVV